MAFLLATIAEFGEPGWQQYWTALRANGVAVVDSWTTAYNERFTRSGGDRPLVVSYGTSPPAEVVFADPPRDDAPSGAVADTCYRTSEYAGVLRGTTKATEAGQLVEFLTSARFQQELPLSIFVYPVSDEVELPDAFVRFAVVPFFFNETAATEIYTPGMALVSDRAEANHMPQTLAFGIMNSAWALGAMVGPSAGGALAEGVGDATPYVLCGAIAALTLLVVGRASHEPVPA